VYTSILRKGAERNDYRQNRQEKSTLHLIHLQDRTSSRHPREIAISLVQDYAAVKQEENVPQSFR
jgi:hypothetical protein